MALRIDLSKEPTFIDLLRRIKEQALDAYANQDIPFERLVSELSPERNLSHAPLFQIMFVMQNLPDNGPQENTTLEMAPLAIDVSSS
ncbi:MAG: hypothetical protein JKX96_02465, partial [Acinetobacter sp.]|nr:hypothetical protein [Acinetobacter sp.]